MAAAAGAWDTAARFVVDDLAVVMCVEARPGTAMHHLLASIPGDAPGAAAALLRAARAFSRRQYEACAREVHTVQEAIDDTPQESRPACTSMLSILLMLLASMTSAPDVAIRAAQNAEQSLADVDSERLARRPEVFRIILATRGAAELALGRLEEAVDAYVGVTQAEDLQDRGSEYVECLGHLALIAAWQGKMRKSVRIAHQALAYRGEAGFPQDSASVPAEVALAWVYAETNDLPRARRHISSAADCGADSADLCPPFARAALAMVRSRMRRARGDLPGSRTPLTDVDEGSTPTWLVDRLRVEQARIDILENCPEHAAESLTDVSAPAREAADLIRAEARVLATDPESAAPMPRVTATDAPERIEKWLLESLWRARRGEEFQAVDALDHALRLAAPEHSRRPFREAPAEVRRFLRPGSKLAARHAWLISNREMHDLRREELARRPNSPELPSPDDEPPMVIEPLTAKETEVLSHLAQLLTTDEIANAMFVSVNTIRTHVRNILRKLSVSRRNEAIRRARELGILSA